jgi:ADP-heptose:LPS heptosyltransferase
MKEAQRIPAHHSLRTREGLTRLEAAEPAPVGSSDVVAKLLDDLDVLEFRSAERLLDALERQGRTIAGYPRARPTDCENFVMAMRVVFDSHRRSFITGDPRIVRRFEGILDAFEKTDVRSYPGALMRARVLQAEARLLLNNPIGARALIRPYADRIYKIEGDRRDILRIMRLDCEAQASLGAIDDLGQVAIARARSATRLWPTAAAKIASTFVEFIGFDRSRRLGDGVLAWLLVRSSRVASRARVPGGSFSRRAWRRAVTGTGVGIAGACLFLLQFGDLRWLSSAHGGKGTPSGNVVVTRAMGGIGDLLIMTAGLRALSKRRATRVKLIVERKYFDLFRNNPYVELIDIDGPPVDVVNCKAWHNLTLCPAGRYEAHRRPFVRKGRAELFAAGMGVGRRLLNAHGWHVDYRLDEGQSQFREDFFREKAIGSRPVIGVQPYARDSYKDHQEIERFVAALSERYDLIIFHHVETSLASGPGIASTAGLSLAESIALASALDAMVCVDSAFLHAAAAFDVPVVALFGPTDGKLFTQHHRRATVITANESFACAPCWRNEDLPCSLTGKFGPSPCIAAIKVEPVLAAVEAALQSRA